MNRISHPAQISALSKTWRSENKAIGFIPTMGYLHAGHLSLIDRARQECDVVVVSIFVNPTQFGPNEDLDAYPRDLDLDAKRCEAAGVDVIFHPEVADMYPEDDVTVDSLYPDLTTKLCGKFRPGHFDGVLLVMKMLLNLVQPTYCYMGKKDAQQLLLIEKMVQDLGIETDIVGCTLVREESGLALSSRNVYLSEEQRSNAVLINRTLEVCADVLFSEEDDVDIESALVDARNFLTKNNLQVQYFDFVDSQNLDPVRTIAHGKYLLCTAVMCGSTRLIDNFFVDIDLDGTITVDRGMKIVE